jgi:hypothetical protein
MDTDLWDEFGNYMGELSDEEDPAGGLEEPRDDISRPAAIQAAPLEGFDEDEEMQEPLTPASQAIVLHEVWALWISAQRTSGFFSRTSGTTLRPRTSTAPTSRLWCRKRTRSR